jgi:xanthine/uracil permease
MFARRWRLAVGLGVVFAAISAFIAISAEGDSPHPGGLEFVAALLWRGVVYGAADGLLLSAFPILLVSAALRDSRLRRRTGGLVAVGGVAMVASLAMTGIYHAGYSDFRSEKLRKPMTGDLVWSVPTLATLNPIGAPIAHVGLHVGAVVDDYDTDLFLPPH